MKRKVVYLSLLFWHFLFVQLLFSLFLRKRMPSQIPPAVIQLQIPLIRKEPLLKPDLKVNG